MDSTNMTTQRSSLSVKAWSESTRTSKYSATRCFPCTKALVAEHLETDMRIGSWQTVQPGTSQANTFRSVRALIVLWDVAALGFGVQTNTQRLISTEAGYGKLPEGWRI